MADKAKILIIEDDMFLSKLYPTKMEVEGFESEVAITGKEGLKKYDSFKPDLIILDLMLPELDGFGVLEELKGKRNVKTPIIVLSNLGQDKDMERAKLLGAEDYFVKSNTELNALVEVIKKYLSK